MTNLQKLSALSIFQKDYESAYDQLYWAIKEKGLQHGLRIEKSAVTSHYGKGNIIDTVYGTTIDLIDTALIVPIDLYKSLANLANCNQESRRLSVCLGYGLRTVNADGSASITTGTHCPLYNTISLDIKAHRQLRNTKGVIKKRFAHEMLHEFGRNETEVLQCEQIYYEKIAEIVDLFINSICIQLEMADTMLENSVNAVFAKDSDERKLLDRMYTELVRLGYPDLSEATIDLLNPIDNMWNTIHFL